MQLCCPTLRRHRWLNLVLSTWLALAVLWPHATAQAAKQASEADLKKLKGNITELQQQIGKDRSHVIEMTNATAWHHPIHLHGHSFRVISRNGTPTRQREWQDTVLMSPRERVEIALVADNPGDWMFHCHILEHQAAGMMAVIRVA